MNKENRYILQWADKDKTAVNFKSSKDGLWVVFLNA